MKKTAMSVIGAVAMMAAMAAQAAPVTYQFDQTTLTQVLKPITLVAFQLGVVNSPKLQAKWW